MFKKRGGIVIDTIILYRIYVSLMEYLYPAETWCWIQM